MRLRTSALILCAALAAAIPLSLRFGDPVERLLGTVRLARPLAAAIPASAHGWTGTDEPLTARERQTILVDDALQRRYAGPDGESVLLFVAFHGNKERGLQRYYHNPTICYRDAGWTLVDTRFDRITLRDVGFELPACRYLFERGGVRLSVTSFFQVDDRILDESPRNKPFWTLLERLTPDLNDGPGSFVQVQVVAPVPGPADGAGASAGDAAATAATERFLQAFGREILSAVEVGVGS